MKLVKNWYEILKEEIHKPYVQGIRDFLKKEGEAGAIVYPPEPLVFNAFAQTPFKDVEVIIMGQDPYHGPGQAHGLSFSVPSGVPLPPSLRNIYKELKSDLGIPMRTDGCLVGWAKQGVLLLNATLTVRANEPKSHHGIGWEQFTDAVVEKLAERKDPLVFILWGSSAKGKCAKFVDGHHHKVLTSAHPSPLSAYQGFFGCKHFSKTNEFLESVGKKAIDWSL